MTGFLFDKIVFGPIHSRRFGQSLGINLLPIQSKMCSFNCVYCECGWNTHNCLDFQNGLVPLELFEQALEEKLIKLNNSNEDFDVITFAGNGEPTLHKDFEAIIDKTIELRNKYCPNTKIVVLTNSTQLHRENVVNALNKIEMPVLKIDSVNQDTFRNINLPAGNLKIENIIENIKKIHNPIIQTIFLRGEVKGVYINNTTDEEINNYIEVLNEISPSLIMIYPIDRPPPAQNLEKLSKEEIIKIANKIQAAGHHVLSV